MVKRFSARRLLLAAALWAAFPSLGLAQVLDGAPPAAGSSTAVIRADDVLEKAELYRRAPRAASASGADDIVLTAASVPATALVDGLTYDFTAAGTNTTTGRVNADGLGLVTLRRADGSALVAGNIQSGRRYRVSYSSAASQWRLAGPVTAAELRNVPAGNIAASDVQAALNELDTEKQPLDTDLTCYAGLASAADKIGYFTGSGTCGLADFSSAIRTFIATPTSANLAAVVSDETGTNKLVYSDSPSLVTPNLGTPTAVNLSNGTALPATSLTGLGAGVATAIVTGANSAGGIPLQSGSPVALNCVRWKTGGGLEDAGTTCGGGGGGGSPGGSSGQIQFNASGSFGGFTASGDATVDTSTGIVKVSGATEDFALKGIISPAQITAQQDNYAPTNLATSTVLRLSTDNDSRALTGLTAQNTGSIRVIENVGSYDLLLYHEHASSTAANRFDTGGPAVVIAKGGVAILKYDGTTSRWRVLSVQGDGQSRAGMRRKTTWFADFLAAGTTMNPPFSGAGISSGTSPINASPEQTHPGIVSLTSSTTTNSGYRWQTDANSIRIGGGEVFECVFFVSTLTNTTTRMGFHDSVTSADAVDGAYIELPAGSGAAVLKTANNSTRTTSGTIATLTTSNWYRAVITVNRDATSVTAEIFDLNGVSLGSQSNTTNIPTGIGRITQAGIVHTNSGTTATIGLNLDYLSFRNGDGNPALR